jgi:hypothetical protein
MFLIKRQSNKMASPSSSKTNGINSEKDFDPEQDPNEMLEYDMWEGQFSLSSQEDNVSNQFGGSNNSLDSFGLCNASTGVVKAIKNARNQQKL